VRRAGFDLTHPYVAQWWGAVIGPSGLALLRRLPVLWTEREPARIGADELAHSLGLGGGTAQNSRLQRTLERTVRFGLAECDQPGQTLSVYTEVSPLLGRRLDRLPEWSRRAHDRLLGQHVDRLAGLTEPTPGVTAVTARLDRLRHPTGPGLAPVPVLGR
jgi:hypothetical protein